MLFFFFFLNFGTKDAEGTLRRQRVARVKGYWKRVQGTPKSRKVNTRVKGVNWAKRGTEVFSSCRAIEGTSGVTEGTE